MIKILSRLIKIFDKLINFITIIFFIIVIGIGIYAIYDSYYIYDNAKLSEDIIRLKPEEDGEKFSLASLQEINKDICGWIRIDGTNIDYPIVIGKDNSEYLNIDYKKEYSTAGSIFLDYRNNRDFEDDYSIIYGHNMKANIMFGDLKKFKDEEFFNSHSLGTLYTNTGVYNLEIFCIAKVSAFAGNAYNLIVYKNGQTNALVKSFKSNSILKKDLDFNADDKLVLLSTCDAQGSNDRFVLVAKMTKKEKTNNEDIINDGTGSSLKKLEEEKDISTTTNNQLDNVQLENISENKVVKLPKIEISLRNLLLIILSIIVLIIFIILIIKRIKIKTNDNGKHSY